MVQAVRGPGTKWEILSQMKSLLPTIVACCGLFVFVNPLFAQSLVFATNNYTVGNGPGCVVAADVNGDGNLDLISANYADNTLTVLTNNGNGVFGFNATLNVGNGPRCVVAADVKGDGKIDLVCANAGANTLTVLTNNGSGVFGSNATYSVGSQPSCVAAADLRGSGKPDLISANYGTLTLTVLTNNGSGLFGSNATYNVLSQPIYVAAADLRGSGKPDLISADYGSQSLTVLTNNGNGAFFLDANIRVGYYPTCVLAADVNGDGKPDLISAIWGEERLEVLTNNGSGVFGSNATINVWNGQSSPWSIVAADINGDGMPDLISANSGHFTLTVLTNNGNGVFGFNATLNVGGSPYCVVAADVNRDGKMDLISANFGLSEQVVEYADTLTVLRQVIVGPPTLTIAPVKTNALVISWSSFSTGFVLQTNSDLTTTNWAPASFPVSIANGTNQSTTIIPSPSGSLFFRLEQ